MLRGKKILLGVSGSIAAYKSALLVRLLIKSGAEVRVIMTESAKDFITPLTLSTLSKNKVYAKPFNPETGEWENHVELGLWADLMVIAPATANTIAKMAYGMADNLLVTTYLSARCHVMISPAMDLDMYQHRSTKNNLATLRNSKNEILEAESGELASGLEGQGRMAEPEIILEAINQHFKKKSKSRFYEKKVMITAGPTQEAIDPVRYITNHSTGKMGYAIANELSARGALVTLISGPVQLEANAGIKLVSVKTAEEMLAESILIFKTIDIAIMSAAVADYRPLKSAPNKIKKKEETLRLDLIKNPDIAQILGKSKTKKQVLVGFALETENELENAKTKLKRKNLDFIVLNSMGDQNAGFGFDTNKISIIDANNKIARFELKPKKEVAKDIVDYLEKYLSA